MFHPSFKTFIADLWSADRCLIDTYFGSVEKADNQYSSDTSEASDKDVLYQPLPPYYSISLYNQNSKVKSPS